MRNDRTRTPGSPLLLLLAVGCLLAGTGGCSKGGGEDQPDERILKLRRAISEGKYESGLDLAQEISSRTPPGPAAEEALYLHGYILAYGKTDFQGARFPLKRQLEVFPKGSQAHSAQSLLADCHFWQGHYETARAEYAKLLGPGVPKDRAAYALYQTANCLLLDDRVVEAQETYRTLVQKHPTDALADSAQLMLANSFLKLQNFKTAKSELKKLAGSSKNKDIQKAVKRALRQLEQEESFEGGTEGE